MSSGLVQPGHDALGEREIARVRRGHFLPYQVRWMDDAAPVKIWEKSRRIGADYVESYAALVQRLAGRNPRDYWYSSADESAAVEQCLYTKHWARLFNLVAEEIEGVEMIDGRDVRVMSLVLPEINGRRVRMSFMTSSPTRFRSKGGDVCLSEFAHHKAAGEMWKAAAPTATRGGTIAVISTHNGEHSEFNRLVEQARRSAEGRGREGDLVASVHRVTIDDAIAEGLAENINEHQGTSYTRASFRQHLRRLAADEDRWNEEFLCVPSSQSASYFPTVLLRDCVSKYAARPTESLGIFLAEINKRAGDCSAIAAGCDVGRVQDRFVIWVTGRMGTMRQTLGVLVYHGLDFREMEIALHALMGRTFGPNRLRVRRLVIDATGLGMQLGERSVGAFRTRCEAVTMTAAVKEDMFTRARAAFEERTFGLPDDDRVLADWTMIRREVTVAGNSRYSADANEHGHADMATAGALSLVADESGKPAMRTVQTTGVW